jgi:hypothetical protein
METSEQSAAATYDKQLNKFRFGYERPAEQLQRVHERWLKFRVRTTVYDSRTAKMVRSYEY